MSNTIEIKCVMDSEFCKGNTWYKIHSMGEHIIYVYLDKHEFVGLPKCHFDMEHIKITVNGNDMQEKVTLKVGDEISVVGYSTRRITDFKKGKIVLVDNGTSFRMYLGEYYVNGKLYARENIIVPDFKEQAMQKVIHDSDCSLHNEPAYPNGDCDCSVSTQEITNDNIMEVLKHNNYQLQQDNSVIVYKNDNRTVSFGNTKGDEYYNINIGGCFMFRTYDAAEFIEMAIKKLDLKPLPKANPFDVVKVGDWVRSLTDCNIWRTKSKWYQRCPDFPLFRYKNNEGDISWSDEPTEWDLTDIRDYNPTECVLKIGDKIITKNGYGHEVHSFGYSNEILYLCNGAFSINFKNINKVIESVNGRKYDRITIPPFDFAKCLVDAGFTLIHGHIGNIPNCTLLINGLIKIEIINNKYFWMEESLEPTPENAKIIIEMAELAKELK